MAVDSPGADSIGPAWAGRIDPEEARLVGYSPPGEIPQEEQAVDLAAVIELQDSEIARLQGEIRVRGEDEQALSEALKAARKEAGEWRAAAEAWESSCKGLELSAKTYRLKHEKALTALRVLSGLVSGSSPF